MTHLSRLQSRITPLLSRTDATKRLNAIISSLALVISIIFCARASADNATYTVFDAASGVYTIPIAMSATGTITGQFYKPGASRTGVHGFLRIRGGTTITIDVPGSSQTYPDAINAAGVISGYYFDSDGNIHGFIRRTDGSFKTFDFPGGCCTTPVSMNGSGETTGYYGDVNHFFHGFVRRTVGRFISFDAPGAGQQQFGEFTAPAQIEDNGTVLGSYVDANNAAHLFLRSSDGFWTLFDPPPGAPGSFLFFDNYIPNGLSINPAGVIIGTYTDPSSGNLRGFIRYRDGTVTTFDGADYPPCCSWTFPYGITPGGVIVGTINDGNFVNRGFVRDADGTSTVFDAPNAGGTIATAITPDGKTIMGVDMDRDGGVHGFIRLTQ
ncbi:MAG TPA: hypothetical protein VGR45_19395 [Stellaceae bacterium]|nr:hypothetical protein [Stellaceae bacterium]